MLTSGPNAYAISRYKQKLGQPAMWISSCMEYIAILDNGCNVDYVNAYYDQQTTAEALVPYFATACCVASVTAGSPDMPR